MFEAYKIATTLELRDLVSAKLLRLSEQFIKLEEKIGVINTTLRELGESRAFVRLAESSRLATDGIRSASRAAANLERHLARISGMGGLEGLAAGEAAGYVGGGRRGGSGDRYHAPSAGGYFMGAGAVGGSVLYMVDKAAQFEKMMIGVKVATHASNPQIKQMQGTIEKSVAPTMFSNVDGAKMAQIMGQSGLSAKQVNELLPIFTQFADIQYLTKSTPYEKSTKELIRLAHTAQHYDAASLANYTNTLNKATMMIPGDIGELGNALKYSQGVGKTALGISDTDMIMMTAFMNRIGLHGSRGGTNLLAAMIRTLPGLFGSGLLKGKSGKALFEMGFADAKGHSTVFRDGKFNFTAWIEQLAKYTDKEFQKHPEAIARQNIARNFQYAFGVQGSRVASLLTSPEALNQLRGMKTNFAELESVEAMQGQFANNSAFQQWQTAKTDFVTAMTNLGQTILPGTTDNLKKFNAELDKFNKWIKDNQSEAHLLVKALLGLAGAMAFAGTVSVLAKTFRTLAWVLGFKEAGGAAGIAATAAATGKQAWSLRLLGGALELLATPLGTVLAMLASAGFAAKGAYDGYQNWKKDYGQTEAGNARRHSAREELNRKLAAVGQPPLRPDEDTANGQKRLELATKGRNNTPPITGSVNSWISGAAKRSRIPEAILRAMINTESGFNPNAISSKGALGIAQWMPGTAAEWGVNPRDPQSSIYGAARFLSYYYGKTHSWKKALQAYNAGPGAMASGRANHFHETRKYVGKILHEAGATAHGKNDQVSLNVYLDGQQITSRVSYHMARAASRPQSGASFFDGGMSQAPTGFA